jgi:probable F420-dependent oxidoreductase
VGWFHQPVLVDPDEPTMKLDAMLLGPDLSTVGPVAAEKERHGYDGLLVAEIQRDPFLPLAVALGHTTSLELGTCIAVALSRSPMHLAQLGHDLQTFSGGRFILGLGSQIRAHVEQRFGADWSPPLPRMRELVQAIHAIWACWNDGVPLRFEGKFYQHTLMPPYFNPGPTGFGPPRVFLAAVGEAMSTLAGEVGDGLFVHSFSTPRYLQEVTLPAVERGLRKARRARTEMEVSLPVLTVTGENDEQMEKARAAVRNEIAFHGSTPAYRPVLDVHGWGALHEDLKPLSKQGRWQAMARLISDEVLDAFAVQGSPTDVAAQVESRYGGLIDRVALYAPYRQHPRLSAETVDAFRTLLV